MKLKLTSYLFFALMFAAAISNAQSNYLDNYIGSTITITTIGTSADQLNQPTDLDFKPESNELWVCNYGTGNGGSMVLFYNAGLSNQTSEYRKDSHSSHFMIYPSAFAFGDHGQWACVSEIQNTNPGSPTFMGPALWLSDTSIFARVFQNPWVNGLPLGSHIDMLHQSPFAMGMAHDSAMAYWVMDGYNGNICKYDFVQDHGPGYDNHSAGKIWRYIDVQVTRVPQVPSHMILDKVNGLLYFIDGGNKTIKRMNVNSGSVTSTLATPPTASELLAGYWKVEGATVETLDSLTTQPCGMDYYNGRLIVSDYTTGDIYLYNTTGTFTLMGTIATGHPGMMGVKVGLDGHIWCVNNADSAVYRLDASLPATDVSITGINSPLVENYISSYYSTAFDICDGNIIPAVTILNNGTNTVTSVDLEYTVDSGSSPVSYTWAGTLASGNTALVNFPSAPAANGSHLLTVKIISVNGNADDVDLNNTYSGSFRIVNPPAPLPFTEDFSSTLFPPQGWNYVHFNPNCFMSRETVGGFGLSTGCMRMDNYSGVMDITGQHDYLMSPIIDMTAATVNGWLHFNVAYAKYNATLNDTLEITVSTDCGNTWTSVYNKSGTALATAPNTTNLFTPTATQWRIDSVSMAAYAGQSSVILSFNSISNYGNELYIDDISLNDISTGVNELSTNAELSIYPNPSSEKLLLKTTENNSSESTLCITDVTGRELVKHSVKLNAGMNTIDLSADVKTLSGGNYFITLKNDAGNRAINFVRQ